MMPMPLRNEGLVFNGVAAVRNAALLALLFAQSFRVVAVVLVVMLATNVTVLVRLLGVRRREMPPIATPRGVDLGVLVELVAEPKHPSGLYRTALVVGQMIGGDETAAREWLVHPIGSAHAYTAREADLRPIPMLLDEIEAAS